ncbi:MAG: hypothetical protein WBB28_15090 [Crinalium sp.]
MRNVSAIPTRYNGNDFASRLEARWAVFWDYLNVRYHYEPLGYRRFPDFFLPDLQMWVEIKPNLRILDEDERESALDRCLKLAINRNQRVLFYDGEVINPGASTEGIFSDVSIVFMPVQLSVHNFDAQHFDNVCWHICNNCGWVDLGNGRLAGLEYMVAPIGRQCTACQQGTLVAYGEHSSNQYLQRLDQAYETAINYRF